MAVKAYASVSLARTDDGIGVSTYVTEFYKSTSATSLAGGSWSTARPTWENGKYIWSRNKTTLTSGTVTYSEPICVTGGIGNTGSTGKGVTSITPEYYLSTSKTAQSGGSWITTPPTWSTGKYLWTRHKIVYNNPTSTVYTTAVCDNSWEAVNEIQIGGRNILLNSKLQTNSQMWNGGVTDYVTKYNRKCAHRKSDALKNTYTLSQSLQGKLEPNTQYTMSGWVLTENIVRGTTNFTIMFYHDGNYNNNGTATWYGYGSKSFTINSGTGAWQYLTWTFATDKTKLENSTSSNMYVYSRDFTGDIYFCNLKLEKGNKATDWSPAPEDLDQIHTGTTAPNDKTMLWLDTNEQPAVIRSWDGTEWSVTNDFSDNINITKETITTEYTEAINQAKGSMEILVGKLTETVTANYDSLIEITNGIKIAPETIDLIKTTSQKVEDLQTGKVSIQDIQEWARFNGSTLELGASNSRFKAMLTNTELGFYQDGTKVAWVSNNELHQLKALIEKSLTIDIWQFESIAGTGLVIRRLKR